MLMRMSGCSAPSNFFLISNTWISSCSASSQFPISAYFLARFSMLMRVSGCSAPSSFFLMSNTSIFSCSASSHFPLSAYVCHCFIFVLFYFILFIAIITKVLPPCISIAYWFYFHFIFFITGYAHLILAIPFYSFLLLYEKKHIVVSWHLSVFPTSEV